MKKTLSIFGMLILFGSVVFGGRTDDPSSVKMAISQVGSTLKVFYKSDSKAAKVSILNEKGRKVFSEVIRIKNGFVRPYDLRKLRKGNYTVLIEDENGETRKEFTLEEAKPVLNSAIVKMKDSRKFALILSGKNRANALITVTDQKNRLIYRENFAVPEQMTKVVDLSSTEGPLKFMIIGNDGKVTTKTIE